MLNLTINTENDAFNDGNRGKELASLLRDVADYLEALGDDPPPRQLTYIADSNGNCCGSWSLTE